VYEWSFSSFVLAYTQVYASMKGRTHIPFPNSWTVAKTTEAPCATNDNTFNCNFKM